jgi:2'-5' RNA ligase
MTEASARPYRAGQTGLIVKVPETEPAVGAWRSQFDPAAAAGVPAHITVLYPFLDKDLADAGVLRRLAAILAAHRALDLRFAEVRRFPGVLYLAPEPAAGLRALTSAIAAQWPEVPPYGGQFDDVVPHLTIAVSQDTSVLDMIESDVLDWLPVTARVESASLIVFDGGHWNELQSFPLTRDRS